MKSIIYLLLFLLPAFTFAQPRLSLDVDKKGVAVSPTHYGIFFEDINHAADGGLYAELIRNRSFEDAATPEFWTTTYQVGAAITTTIETTNLLNANQSKALKLTVSAATSTARAGVFNTGFWGINIVSGQVYKLTFFAKRNATFNGSITASLESTTGVKYAQATVSSITEEWVKYTCTLIATGNDPSARFVITTNSPGTIWLDMVSLFPPTFKNRENGLRPELAQLLADLSPKFMRFPGGCFVEGDVLANRFQWKKTIGPIENRPGHWNLWNYRTSDGMGYHEFLQLCEDLNTKPLYVANVGLAHNDNQPYNSLGEYIQDALDALEYANGAVTSTYGAMRAANGHPAPFNINYIEIGNENYHGDNYGNRYIQFYNAIKAKYPTMQCIGNVAAWGTDNPTWTFTHPVELLDEHYYRSPQWFINQYNKYDTYSRTGPKIYAGEYAVTIGCGNGNQIAAIGEAVYMAGMENNSDVVPLNSYAPIFVNVNDRKWNPDMICYNAAEVYCTPSYYVQKMFANNIGTVIIPVKDSLNTKITPITGAVGLGTWSTKAEYSDVKVTNSLGSTLFADQFASSTNWTPSIGTWAVAGGIYSQTSTLTDCRSIGKAISDSVYTYSVKARKTSGGEGFLIAFGYKDSNNFYWWNLGGWGNTQHAIEQCIDGTKSVLSTVPGSITTNQWYDIRIEVSSSKVLFYLNNVLIQTLNNAASRLLYTTASLDENNHQLYLKVINPSTVDILSKVDLKGAINVLGGQATVLSSGNGLNENTLANKTSIVPVTTAIESVSKAFNYTFKANSVTVLQLNTSVINALPLQKKSEVSIEVYPNPTSDFITLKGIENERATVEIQNLIGQTVLKTEVSNNARIDLSVIKSGSYILKVQDGNRIVSTKLLKE